MYVFFNTSCILIQVTRRSMCPSLRAPTSSICMYVYFFVCQHIMCTDAGDSPLDSSSVAARVDEPYIYEYLEMDI